jgi:hypothetical protein
MPPVSAHPVQKETETGAAPDLLQLSLPPSAPATPPAASEPADELVSADGEAHASTDGVNEIEGTRRTCFGFGESGGPID